MLSADIQIRGLKSALTETRTMHPQIPREFDDGRSRYVVWIVRHVLLSVPRIFQE